MSTYSAKPSDVERKWYILDASEVTLGRLSTQAAIFLMGKQKPMFTKHIDTGDYVIIINAGKLRVTGKKLDQKMYYRHSGYPGGLTETALKDKMAQDPTKVIFQAIRGMLPVNKLRDESLNRLKIYVDDQHMHEAQKPEVVSIKERV